MIERTRLFGPGAYPDNGLWAVLARLAFLLAVAGIIAGVYLPPHIAPDFARSHYLEHFAAFYVAALSGLAAFPRAGLRKLGFVMLVFATGLETSHFIGPPPVVADLLRNWEADLGGVLAALVPTAVANFRARFPRRLS